MKLKAVFLDKDGALIPEIPADRNEKFEMNERFIEGLQLLQSYGYLLVIVSNPAGKNNVDGSEEVDDFKRKLIRSCSKLGIYIDGFYYGPSKKESAAQSDVVNHDDAGLLLKAAGDMDIDLSLSWVVGDIISDVEACKRAGCKAVLVDDKATAKRHDGLVAAKDLADAARKIVKSGLGNGQWAVGNGQ